MKKVLMLVNHEIVIYNFRLELVEALLREGYEVHISSPYGEKIDELVALGAKFHDIQMDRHGMNPLQELRLVSAYKRLMSDVQPDVVLGYTVKPNLYGAMVAGWYGIPFIANITGLGIAMQTKSLSQKIILVLYHISFKKVKKVYFQNTANRQFFIDHNIAIGRHEVLPGSGVNIDRYYYQEYPAESDIIKFLFIGRLMKDKGIEEFVEAAKVVKKHYPKAELMAVGRNDGDYVEYINNAAQEGWVTYFEERKDVKDLIGEANCVVLPSYHEGMANVLLEAASSGRPVIASDIPGCRETFEEGKTGIKCRVKSSEDLARAMMEFINLPYDTKKNMGINGREKMVKEFDRRIVVNEYLKEIRSDFYSKI